MSAAADEATVVDDDDVIGEFHQLRFVSDHEDRVILL